MQSLNKEETIIFLSEKQQEQIKIVRRVENGKELAVKIRSTLVHKHFDANKLHEEISCEEYFPAGSLRDILSRYFYKGLIRDKTSKSGQPFLDENLIAFILLQILN